MPAFGERSPCLAVSRITRSLVTARRRRSFQKMAPSTGFAGRGSNSAACFAALLGNADNGRWQIAPAAVGREVKVQVKRRYQRNTLVLETEFTAADGSAVVLIDFMPVRQGRAESSLIRLVACSSHPFFLIKIFPNSTIKSHTIMTNAASHLYLSKSFAPGISFVAWTARVLGTL